MPTLPVVSLISRHSPYLKSHDYLPIFQLQRLLVTESEEDSISVEDSINEGLTRLATSATTLGQGAFSLIINAALLFPLIYFLQGPSIATTILHFSWANRMLKGGYVHNRCQVIPLPWYATYRSIF